LIDRRNYHLFQPQLYQVATGSLSPPLRERREDIPLLIRFFTQRYVRKMNRVIEEIPAAALEALTRYSWPGNIRELQTWWNAPSS
jgi:transcriptional regulator with GAF, ATPase, and Fis domain